MDWLWLAFVGSILGGLIGRIVHLFWIQIRLTLQHE